MGLFDTSQLCCGVVHFPDALRRGWSLQGKKEPAAFTGKAVADGGSLGRTEATGYGGVIAMQELLKRLYPDKQTKMKIAIQGFGNVGYHFAEAAADEGHTIVAPSYCHVTPQTVH